MTDNASADYGYYDNCKREQTENPGSSRVRSALVSDGLVGVVKGAVWWCGVGKESCVVVRCMTV